MMFLGWAMAVQDQQSRSLDSLSHMLVVEAVGVPFLLQVNSFTYSHMCFIVLRRKKYFLCQDTVLAVVLAVEMEEMMTFSPILETMAQMVMILLGVEVAAVGFPVY